MDLGFCEPFGVSTRKFLTWVLGVVLMNACQSPWVALIGDIAVCF